MSNEILNELKQMTGLEIYEASMSEADGVRYFLGRRGLGKFVGCVGEGKIAGEKVGEVGEVGGQAVLVGPTDHANAVAVRELLPWTAPKCLGLATSVGLGDRLGVATPGHIRAVRGSGLQAVLAQQSIREMTRTQRTPEEILDCATWGVLQEGWRFGYKRRFFRYRRQTGWKVHDLQARRRGIRSGDT